MTTDKMIETCQMIADDAKKDAEEFDGKPFDGKTVAQYFGNHGASINALACILKQLIIEVVDIKKRLPKN